MWTYLHTQVRILELQCNVRAGGIKWNVIIVIEGVVNRVSSTPAHVSRLRVYIFFLYRVLDRV